MVHLNLLSPEINKLTYKKKKKRPLKNEYVQNCYHWSVPSVSFIIFSLWTIHVSPLSFLIVPACSITLLSCRWTFCRSVAMATRAISIVAMSIGEVTSCSFRTEGNDFIPPKAPGLCVGWCPNLPSAGPDVSSSRFSRALPSWLLRRSCCKVAFKLLSLAASSCLSSTKPCCSLTLACSACALHADSRLGRHCWHVPLASLSTCVLREDIPPQHCSRESSSMFCLMWEFSRAMNSLSQREKSAVWHGVVGVSPVDKNQREN